MRINCCHVGYFILVYYSAIETNLEQPNGTDGCESDDGRSKLSILHFNDVYNIEANSAVEPIGGAARFCTAIKSFSHLNPLVLFSGDAFSPSMRKFCSFLLKCLYLIIFVALVSTYTKGRQMVPVLNAIGTHCAVFGNHDFGMQ